MRFLGFEGEWEERKLGVVSELINERISSYLISLSDYVSTENLRQNFEGIVPASSIPSNVNVTAYKTNDILFSNIRPYLKKIWKANLNGGCSSDVFVFRNRESCLSQFLYYSIANDSFINYVMTGAKGIKMPRGDKQQILEYPLYIPSKTEQQKIASLLSLIDERIQKSIKIIQRLETSMQGLREKLFNRKIKFKDENGKDFPNWEVKPLGKILTIGNGKDYKHLGRGDIPVFGTGGLMTYVDSFLYNGETICIGRKGTIDKPMYYQGKIWTVDTLFYTHSFLSCVPKFIFYIFQSINWIEYNEASGVPSLSKSTIEKIPLLIPSLAEQTLIANFLSFVDEKIEAEKKILEQYKNQKKYLLRNMFV